MLSLDVFSDETFHVTFFVTTIFDWCECFFWFCVFVCFSFSFFVTTNNNSFHSSSQIQTNKFFEFRIFVQHFCACLTFFCFTLLFFLTSTPHHACSVCLLQQIVLQHVNDEWKKLRRQIVGKKSKQNGKYKTKKLSISDFK